MLQNPLQRPPLDAPEAPAGIEAEAPLLAIPNDVEAVRADLESLKNLARRLVELQASGSEETQIDIVAEVQVLRAQLSNVFEDTSNQSALSEELRHLGTQFSMLQRLTLNKLITPEMARLADAEPPAARQPLADAEPPAARQPLADAEPPAAEPPAADSFASYQVNDPVANSFASYQVNNPAAGSFAKQAGHSSTCSTLSTSQQIGHSDSSSSAARPSSSQVAAASLGSVSAQAASASRRPELRPATPDQQSSVGAGKRSSAPAAPSSSDGASQRCAAREASPCGGFAPFRGKSPSQGRRRSSAAQRLSPGEVAEPCCHVRRKSSASSSGSVLSSVLGAARKSSVSSTGSALPGDAVNHVPAGGQAQKTTGFRATFRHLTGMSVGATNASPDHTDHKKSLSFILQEWEDAGSFLEGAQGEAEKLSKLTEDARHLVSAHREVAGLVSAAGDNLDTLGDQVEGTANDTSGAVEQLGETSKTMARGWTLKAACPSAAVGLGVGFWVAGPVGAVVGGSVCGTVGAVAGKAAKRRHIRDVDRVLALRDRSPPARRATTREVTTRETSDDERPRASSL